MRGESDGVCTPGESATSSCESRHPETELGSEPMGKPAAYSAAQRQITAPPLGLVSTSTSSSRITSDVQDGALPDETYIPDDIEFSDAAESKVDAKPDERSDTLNNFDGETFLDALRSEDLFEPASSD
ncbi:hypothetical protein GN958_ATG13416 [Phytophthora infestans]|uniref:Uncharacterized protein n=1 Tax=Phytophthora infestans TaxID=4787 RepID=A0A8S9UDL9_PHYIN|nr:hypothetical protein GN958_ATG13416 [Phytophthora infestans]